MDDLITCNRCGSKACYVKNISDELTSYQCYGCGFVTNNLMKRDSKFLEEQMNKEV